MNKLNISTRLLSEAVWRRVFETSAPQLMHKRDSFFAFLLSLEELRQNADYNTGSISTSSAWALYSVTSLFQPRMVLEVGTFIGKSTMSMAIAMDDSGVSKGEIHTCDLSNDIKLPTTTRAKIIQYPKQSSTDMLKKISSSTSIDQFQMIHLDGRLQPEDFSLLSKHCSGQAVIALDDFEGFEKGTANFANLQQSGLLSSHILIYPPSENLLKDFNFFDHSTTALLLHQASIDFTPQ